MSNKSREFWILDNGEWTNVAVPKEYWDDFKEEIREYPDYHVIEYSALASLQEELDKTTECLIVEQNMREALKKERDQAINERAVLFEKVTELRAENDGYKKHLELFEESIRESFRNREDKLRADLKLAVEALKSISKNSCCDKCQEAKLVSLEALKELNKKCTKN